MKNFKMDINPLRDYFDKSDDFKSHSNNYGKSHPYDYCINVDGEKDDRNKFIEYIAVDESFIVHISAHDIRSIQIKINKSVPFNGYKLQLIRKKGNQIRKYRIVQAI